MHNSNRVPKAELLITSELYKHVIKWVFGNEQIFSISVQFAGNVVQE